MIRGEDRGDEEKWKGERGGGVEEMWANREEHQYTLSSRQTPGLNLLSCKMKLLMVEMM